MFICTGKYLRNTFFNCMRCLEFYIFKFIAMGKLSFFKFASLMYWPFCSTSEQCMKVETVIIWQLAALLSVQDFM